MIREFVTVGLQSLGKRSCLTRPSSNCLGERTPRGKLRMHAEQIENKKDILLITGESASSLRVGLEQEGCHVTVCESPQKAWGFVYPIRPDVIVLHLPQSSDKDIYVLRECLALADGVPVIVATAESRIEAFTKEIRRVLPRFLSLPLKPNAAREALHGLESEWGK